MPSVPAQDDAFGPVPTPWKPSTNCLDYRFQLALRATLDLRTSTKTGENLLTSGWQKRIEETGYWAEWRADFAGTAVWHRSSRSGATHSLSDFQPSASDRDTESVVRRSSCNSIQISW